MKCNTQPHVHIGYQNNYKTTDAGSTTWEKSTKARQCKREVKAKRPTWSRALIGAGANIGNSPVDLSVPL